MFDKSRPARRCLPFIGAVILAATLPLATASAHDPGKDIVLDDGTTVHLHPAGDPHAAMAHHDAATADIVSSAPSAHVVKNLEVAGRGARLSPNSTTDVWAIDGHAYTGTFNSPCGGEEGAGIWVWNTRNVNKPEFVGIIPSPVGSRSNDVKVANMNSGRILVHSNEACAGGPGGFEIYNVDDPANPVPLAHVQTDDINILIRDNFGFTDFGVHNLFLFTHGDRDYVAAVVESLLGNFQIFDITNPSAPALIGSWGAEQLFDASVDWVNTTDIAAIVAAQDYLNDGFGSSQNRFLHDITITGDGMKAYLANWDAGLVLLDISDATSPSLVSVAIDSTSEDGEVNSHSVWPSGDGSVVVEGEEDFAPFATVFNITSGPNAGEYPAAEGAITVPIASLPGQTMSGPTVYVGGACPPGNPGFDDPVPPVTGEGQIALIQRGACFFSEKIDNAAAAGYAGVVVFNDEARGDALVSMGGDPTNLPGVFVGHSTGLAIAGATTAADLVIGGAGESVSASTEPNGWSGLRVWDYSDPANPMLASTINTVCSANPVDASCDPAGVYSSHNVIVEDTDDGRVKAYVSWYADGVLIFDVTDPSMPLETARYARSDDEFVAENGGAQDVWGIYKEPGKPWIYASDRNGGLYVLKEYGAGSAKMAKN